nr:FRG domain-containing protein [Deinococcus xianganensis]
MQRLSNRPQEVERHLVRAFRQYALASVPAQPHLWAWLALGQHHGLPTRLLDWRYSPLVALHFAASDGRHDHEDGVVWMLDSAACAARLPAPLSELLTREGSLVFTTDLLSSLSDGTSAAPPFDAETGWPEQLERESGEPFLVLLEPPSIDQRIVQQAALFALLSSPDMIPERWLQARPHLARRVVVPRELKAEVRDRLDQFNVTERTLFPDLHGLIRTPIEWALQPVQSERSEWETNGFRTWSWQIGGVPICQRNKRNPYEPLATAV